MAKSKQIFYPQLTITKSMTRPKDKINFGLARIRNGEHQTLETLINEEAQLFAKYLRGEVKAWVPRVPGS
jgi:hypothetical protein